MDGWSGMAPSSRRLLCKCNNSLQSPSNWTFAFAGDGVSLFIKLFRNFFVPAPAGEWQAVRCGAPPGMMMS